MSDSQPPTIVLESLPLQPSEETRVLVIYTGGTIGMLVGPQGYVPEPNFLTETLRCQSRFHDPFQDSLFSHASTVKGYREWSNMSSGRSTPRSTHSLPLHPSLPVRSSHPVGRLDSQLRDHEPERGSPIDHQPAWHKVSDDVYEAHLPTLVTPRSTIPGCGTKRIRYAILEWNPLLDSSNMGTADWIRIATEIELNYNIFDAFVVLHGTDTMCYTSSALSFILEDLGKTVVLTGAQIPLAQLRNDSVDNLMGALTIAGHYIIPECCVYFNHTLFRGNRVSKISSYDLHAFNSPNFPPIVDVGIDIVVNWNVVIRQTSLRRFKAHKQMSPHIAALRLVPGITAATIRALLSPPIRGVVLETFGAGNAPQRPDLIKTLKEAAERGVVIVAISQCQKGTVSDAYETGRTLQQAGVVPGADMTPECALTKLCYLLSKPELTPSQVRNLAVIPLRGELTLPASTPPTQLSLDLSTEHIQGLLSRFVRLSRPPSRQTPQIIDSQESLDDSAHDSSATWTWTAAEALSTEAALFPFLIHLAAARDDIEALKFTMDAASHAAADGVLSTTLESQQYKNIAAGIVNCLDVGSGRAPLHVAALNGSTRCAQLLLQSGALVHLRDALGHTALYYAARQRHESTVEVLVQAGGSLAGLDIEGGFVQLAVKLARHANDQTALRVWSEAGILIPKTNGIDHVPDDHAKSHSPT